MGTFLFKWYVILRNRPVATSPCRSYHGTAVDSWNRSKFLAILLRGCLLVSERLLSRVT